MSTGGRPEQAILACFITKHYMLLTCRWLPWQAPAGLDTFEPEYPMFNPVLMEADEYYPLPFGPSRPAREERWCASMLNELAPPGVSLDDLNSWEYWDSVPAVAAPWGTPGMHWREYWVRLCASCRCSALSPSQSRTR